MDINGCSMDVLMDVQWIFHRHFRMFLDDSSKKKGDASLRTSGMSAADRDGDGPTSKKPGNAWAPVRQVVHNRLAASSRIAVLGFT